MGEKPEGENLKKADDKKSDDKDAAMKKMDDGAGAGKSERIQAPDEPPEPAESANLNLSKSNMRDGGSPEAAEATNLNSSKSNIARGGVAAPPQDPAATNLNTSRSN